MVEAAATSTATIRVFGGVGLEVSGRPVSVGGPRQRRLLALLAIRAGEVVGIDWLAEYLWSDADRPTDTASALRTYVSRLRQSLPDVARDWIVTEQSGYRLTVPQDAIEHDRLTSLRSEARRLRESGHPSDAQELLDAALEMWRGDPFRELEDLDWAQPHIERLRLDRLEMLEERWETALALGRHTQITGELAAFIGEQPLRERAARQYALALYRSGRTAEALRVLDDHRRLLADVSGLDPSSAITELEEAILSADPALDLAVDASPLRGYRLLEQVGAGAFSVVWRGLQPSVDRTVAIKQIRSELASQPDFIRRFEAEARLVAHIEHPHVVPLIDFWRDPDAAYLVMRWLPGGTLERLLDDGPLRVQRALEIARDIGSALSAAHAGGIIHRDVKSANVMFDEAGNAFLTDFGIALPAVESSGPAAALSTGSPAYASPEQLRREPLSPASDVYSLAVVVYECLVGRTPFADSTTGEMLLDRQLHEVPAPVTGYRSDVREHVSDALARALSKDPAARFPSVEDFVRALEGGEASITTAARRPSIDGNPYLGLRPFDQADAGRFFGRRRLVSELVGRLGSPDTSRSRALVVVGPSGSGKSSVVRAGLLPALQAGSVEGSERWFTTTMVPGTEPFESLEAALLRIAVNPPASLVEQLRQGPRGILRATRRCLPGEDNVMVLVIDQLEEVFVGASAETAHAFLEALAVAVSDPSSPVRVIGTLRADFYDRPLEHPAFAPILKAGSVDVTPLAADELQEAIEAPARLAGVEFESGLVARIAAETMGQPSPLPLLQHVLAELYERRSGHLLTVGAYEQLGGVSGALAARAESIHAEADADQRTAMRRLFGALTDHGDDRTDIRRRVPVEDLGDSESMGWVLERFGEARLLTFDRDSTTRRPTVEVAHEALLREWPRLAGWLDDDRDLLRSIERIAAAAGIWSDLGRQPSDLLRGGRLTAALDLALMEPERFRPLDREYLDASRLKADAEHEAERRRARRLRRLNVGVSVALVIAVVAGAAALLQRNSAVRASDAAEAASEEAELAALIGQADALVDEDSDLATLLALEAHRRSPEPRTRRAVLGALTGAPARITTVDLPTPGRQACPSFTIIDTREVARRGMTLSGDGLTGFTTVDGRLVTVDLTSGATTDRGPAPAGCVLWTGDRDADSRWVTQAGDTGYVHWSGTFEGELRRVPTDDVGPFLPGTLVGDRLLLLINDRVGEGIAWPKTEVVLFDARSQERVSGFAEAFGLRVGPASSVLGEVWAAGDDGRYVMVSEIVPLERGFAPGVLVVDTRTGEPLHRIRLPEFPSAAAIRGHVAYVGGNFGGITTIDLVSGEILSEIATSSASEVLAIGGRPDGTAMVVTADRVRVVDPLRGDVGPPAMIRVGEAVVRPDGRVTVIDPSGTTASTVEMQTTAVVRSSFDIDPGSTVGFGGGSASVLESDGDLEVVDLRTGERSVVAAGSMAEATSRPAAVFPSQEGFVTFEEGAEVWRWSGGEVVDRLTLAAGGGEWSFTPEEWSRSDFSPGPSHAASGAVTVFQVGDRLNNVHAIDWADGSLEAHYLTENLDVVSAIAIPGNGFHVLNSRGLMRSYDAEGSWTGETMTGIRYPLAVAHDGGALVAAGGIGGAVVVGPEAGDLQTIPGIGNVAGLTFARDGELLVILERDGSVFVWDVVAGAPIGRIWRGTAPVQVSQPWYDSEHDSVWVATGNRLLELDLDPARWVEEACSFVGRDLTAEERERYVPGDDAQTPVCP